MPRQLNLDRVPEHQREFVKTVEEVLDRRQAAKKDSDSAERDWTLDELYYTFPRYRDIRRGKSQKQVTEEELEAVVDYLQCTRGEQDSIYASLNYPPVEERLERDALDDALATATRILEYIPLPAYVIRRDWNIYAWNPALPKLFGITHEELEKTEYPQRNVLHYIFNPSTPVYPLLTNYGENFSWWDYTARLNLYWFSRDNIRSRNDYWYKQLIDTLNPFPGFSGRWRDVRADVPIKAPGSSKTFFPEYVTTIFAPKDNPFTIRGLQIRYINREYPRIVAYMPNDDKRSREVFTALGLPTPDNHWTLSNPLLGSAGRV